jgi:hypothetical protein
MDVGTAIIIQTELSNVHYLFEEDWQIRWLYCQYRISGRA